MRLAIGWILLASGVAAMEYSLYVGMPGWVIWFCYVGSCLMGLGALLNRRILIVSQIYILLVPTTVWLIDFGYRLTMGDSLWHVTDYLWQQLTPGSRLISLEHFFVVPLGLLAARLTQGSWRRSGVVSASQIALLYIASRFLTPPGQNVNCVFESCLAFVASGNGYIWRWWAVVGLATVGGYAAYNLIALAYCRAYNEYRSHISSWRPSRHD